MEEKYCPQCEQVKPKTFFRENRTISHGAMTKTYRHSLCLDCEFHNRRQVYPTIETKARTFISRHSQRIGADSKAFAEWGISLKFIEYLIERELTLILNGFHYCPNCLPEKGKSKKPCIPKELTDNPTVENIIKILGMLSIDVIDPERMLEKKKLTRSNVRILCVEANRYKASIDPTLYDLRVVSFNQDKETLLDGRQLKLSLPI